MLCPKCGAENAEGSQFCGQCGATFSPIPQPVQSNVSAQQPVFNQQTNVNLDNKYTVLDISELSGDLL